MLGGNMLYTIERGVSKNVCGLNEKLGMGNISIYLVLIWHFVYSNVKSKGLYFIMSDCLFNSSLIIST